MIDLSTNYLGLNLKHPIVASASPLSNNLAGIQRLARGGVSAVVLESLFEEYIDLEASLHERYLTQGSYAEALSYFPESERYRWKPDDYLSLIEKARQNVDIPIIASLNGTSAGGWLEYARSCQDAGAHAIELNLYNVPSDPEDSSAAVENRYLDAVRQVCQLVTIPVTVKLSPFFTSLPFMARRFERVGARGLVLFNRFHQPDFDLDNLEVVPHLELSRSYEMLLPLNWVAILFGKVDLDLAITGGVHTASDLLKAMLAGARAVLMASRILHEGPGFIPGLLDEVQVWLQEREYESLRQLQGSMSQRAVADPSPFERANYMKTLHSYRAG